MVDSVSGLVGIRSSLWAATFVVTAHNKNIVITNRDFLDISFTASCMTLLPL